jgi:hypothetical protein
VTGPGQEYSVRVPSISAVEYREPGRTVRFLANMRDHEVHLGHETVAGAALTDDERELVIERTYTYLNDVRHMRIDFVQPDGSFWGRPQGWQVEPLNERDRARIRARAERRRRISQFLRSVVGR